MSLKFLYGESYDELNGPKDWQGIGVQATINDDAFEAQINSAEFVFAGPAAQYMENVHIPQWGVHVGCPLRIQSYDSSGNYETIFDGMVVLRDREILSKSGPILFRAPIEELNNTISVFDKMAVLSQRVLKNQGYLVPSDFVDVPVIRESKKNIAERAVILGQIGYQVVSMFIRIVQDFMSAISDIIGLSAVLGLIEIFLLFANTVIEINLLMDRIIQNKDLFWPAISYYKGISVKTLLEKAFLKEGIDVDFGAMDSFLSKVTLLASQNDFDGYPTQGVLVTGELKPGDYGYLIGEVLTFLKDFQNTRSVVIDGTAHIKRKNDPFWASAPSFSPEDAIVETTEQYSNGTIKENTEEVYATTIINYLYDPSDAHTLTEKTGDSFEIHRRPIAIFDEKFNLMRGLQEIQIPYAMAVRKGALDNLWDLFTGINDSFDIWLNYFQGKLDEYASYIDTSSGGGSSLIDILNMTPLGFILENRNGCLKIEDNTYGIPKILYLEDYSVGKRIPANFKDFIGARAIYYDCYFFESPAEQNNFLGQKVLRKGWRIPFSLANYLQTKDYPYFTVSDISGKFNTINWIGDEGAAVTEAEHHKIFDTNITEDEID